MPEISELHQVDLQSGRITKLRWSNDGRLLAISTQFGSTVIFDIDANEVAHTLEGHSEITAVAWDPRSDLIMTGSADRSIGLVGTEERKKHTLYQERPRGSSTFHRMDR